MQVDGERTERIARLREELKKSFEFDRCEGCAGGGQVASGGPLISAGLGTGEVRAAWPALEGPLAREDAARWVRDLAARIGRVMGRIFVERAPASWSVVLQEPVGRDLKMAAPEERGRSAFQWPDPPDPDKYSACVHCGLCLEACPTYQELGLEDQSPRGCASPTFSTPETGICTL